MSLIGSGFPRYPSTVRPEWKTTWAMEEPNQASAVKLALENARKQRERWLQHKAVASGPGYTIIGSAGESSEDDNYFAAKQNEIDVAELENITAGKGPLETKIVGGGPQAPSRAGGPVRGGPFSGLEQAAGERGVQVPPDADLTGADVEMARRARAAMVRSLPPAGEPPLTPPAQMPTTPPNQRFGAELAPSPRRGGVQAFTETSPAFAGIEGRAQQSALQRAARERAVTGAVTPAETMAMGEREKQAVRANALAIAQEKTKAVVDAARERARSVIEASRLRNMPLGLEEPPTEPTESGETDFTPGEEVEFENGLTGTFVRWTDDPGVGIFIIDGQERTVRIP